MRKPTDDHHNLPCTGHDWGKGSPKRARINMGRKPYFCNPNITAELQGPQSLRPCQAPFSGENKRDRGLTRELLAATVIPLKYNIIKERS